MSYSVVQCLPIVWTSLATISFVIAIVAVIVVVGATSGHIPWACSKVHVLRMVRRVRTLAVDIRNVWVPHVVLRVERMHERRWMEGHVHERIIAVHHFWVVEAHRPWVRHPLWMLWPELRMESIRRKSPLEISHWVAWVRVTTCCSLFTLGAVQERIVMSVTLWSSSVMRVEIGGVVLRWNITLYGY